MKLKKILSCNYIVRLINLFIALNIRIQKKIQNKVNSIIKYKIGKRYIIKDNITKNNITRNNIIKNDIRKKAKFKIKLFIIIYIILILITLNIYVLSILLNNIYSIYMLYNNNNQKDLLNVSDTIQVSNIENSFNNYNIIYKDDTSKIEDVILKKNIYNSIINNKIDDKINSYLNNNNINIRSNTSIDKNNIINVPYISQDKYPTGCESVSAVMLLKYFNIDISVSDFIDKYLKKEPFKIIDNKAYSLSPFDAFIGNPYNINNSYGCYSNVIVDAINNVLKSYKIDNKYKVVNLKDNSLEEISNNYIKNNIPVIIWGSIDMKPIYNSISWNLYDNTTYTWKANEHCLVLVGENENYYYFNDPKSNNTITKYKKDIVEDRYNTLNRQAILLLKC